MSRSQKKRALWVSGAILILLSMIACGRPFAGKDHSGHLLKKLDKTVASLELNAEQQAYYDRMRADIKADLEKRKNARKETARKIKAELNAANPDMNKVAAVAREQLQKHPQFLDNLIDHLTGFYSQLNAEQQEKVRALLNKRLSRFDS